MKRLSKRILVLLVTCLVFRGPSGMAQSASTSVYKSLFEAINRVRDSDFGPFQEKVSDLWLKMIMDASTLASLHQTNEPMPDLYRRSLELDSKALDRISTPDSSLNVEARFGICEGVTIDLSAKVKASKKTQKPYPLITVTATTLDGSAPKQGYEVWCVVEAWRDDPAKQERFNKLSTPTDKILAPGYYVMWTCKSKKDGDKKPVKVEGASFDKQGVDLPVPN